MSTCRWQKRYKINQKVTTTHDACYHSMKKLHKDRYYLYTTHTYLCRSETSIRHSTSDSHWWISCVVNTGRLLRRKFNSHITCILMQLTSRAYKLHLLLFSVDILRKYSLQTDTCDHILFFLTFSARSFCNLLFIACDGRPCIKWCQTFYATITGLFTICW